MIVIKSIQRAQTSTKVANYHHIYILTLAEICTKSSALKSKLKEDVMMIIQSQQFL